MLVVYFHYCLCSMPILVFSCSSMDAWWRVVVWIPLHYALLWLSNSHLILVDHCAVNSFLVSTVFIIRGCGAWFVFLLAVIESVWCPAYDINLCFCYLLYWLCGGAIRYQFVFMFWSIFSSFSVITRLFVLLTITW